MAVVDSAPNGLRHEEVANSGKPNPSERTVQVALVASWILSCLPLFFVQYFPSVDFPNHLARISLLARGLSQPGYANFYHSHWTFLPNLAFDLLAVPLAKIVSVELAGKVFLAICFAGFIFGGALLNRAVAGRLTWISLAPAFLVFNRVLTFGFVNFVFGVGLLMFAFAVHIIFHRSPRAWRLLIDLLFMVGLLASHIVALALFLIAVVLYDASKQLSERNGWKRAVEEALYLLVPCALIFAFVLVLSPTSGEVATIHYGTLDVKLKLLYISWLTGLGALDSIFSTAFLILIAWLIKIKSIGLQKSAIAMLLGLLLIFFVMPSGFGEAANVDTRVPLVITVLALACLVPLRPEPRWVGIAFGLLLCFRTVTTSLAFIKDQRATDQLISDCKVIPPGAALFSVAEKDSKSFLDTGWNPPYVHLACVLLIQKPLFVSDLFTIPSQQPLLRNAPYDQIDLPEEVNAVRATNLNSYSVRIRSAMKTLKLKQPAYVYLVRSNAPLAPAPLMTPIVIRKRYALFKVNP